VVGYCTTTSVGYCCTRAIPPVWWEQMRTLKRSLPFFLFFFVLFLVPIVHGTGLEDGLGVHWGFDENTGNLTTDDVNSYTAVPIEANTSFNWESNGIIGSSIDIYNDTPAINRTVSYGISDCNSNCVSNTSLSFWVYPFDTGYNTFQNVYHTSGAQSFQVGISGNTVKVYNTGVCITSNDVPLIQNEWNHVVVTFGTGVSDANIYINGDASNYTNVTGVISTCGITQPSAIDTIGVTRTGGGGSSRANYLYGSIDEIAYWNARELTETEAISLFNNGLGLPYNSYSLIAPSQITNFADIELGTNDLYQIYLNDFFSDYGSAYVSFPDDIAGANVFLTVDKTDNESSSYITPYIRVQLTPTGDDIRVRIFSNSTAFSSSVVFAVENGLGSASDYTGLSILGATSELSANPEQLASFVTPVTIPYNSFYTWDMDDFFNNYDGITIYIEDYITGLSTSITSNVNGSFSNYSINAFNISIIPSGSNKLSVRVSSNQTEVDIPLSINAFYQVANNSYNTLENSLTINIKEFGSVAVNPPVQIASLGDIIIEPTKSYTFRFKDFMQDYTGSAITFEDDASGTTVYVTDGVTYEQGNYTISIAGDTVRITAGSVELTQEMNIYGINQAGDLYIPFRLVIGTVDYGGMTTGTDIFRDSAGWFVSLFPNSDDLSFPARMSFVIMTMILSVILLMGISIFAGTNNFEPIVKFIIPMFLVVEFIFFIAIGYVPKTLVIVMVVIAVAIMYLLTSRNN